MSFWLVMALLTRLSTTIDLNHCLRARASLPGFWNAWTAAEALEYTHSLVTNEEGGQPSLDVMWTCCLRSAYRCSKVVPSSKQIPSISEVFARTLCDCPSCQVPQMTWHRSWCSMLSKRGRRRPLVARGARRPWSGHALLLWLMVQDNVSVVVLHIMPQAAQ